MKKSAKSSLALAIPMSVETLEDVRAQCKALVTRRAGLSAGATVVPIPGLDIGADMLLLSEMLQTINRRFGLSQAQIDALDPQLKKIILVAATSIGSEVVGRAKERVGAAVEAGVVGALPVRRELRVVRVAIVRQHLWLQRDQV